MDERKACVAVGCLGVEGTCCLSLLSLARSVASRELHATTESSSHSVQLATGVPVHRLGRVPGSPQ
jgi:hypothetical protein